MDETRTAGTCSRNRMICGLYVRAARNRSDKRSDKTLGDRHNNVRAVMDLAEAISEERFEQACLGRASDREACGSTLP